MVAVTGSKREAAVLRGLDVAPVAGGSAPERLAAELDRLATGAAGIVSFGMAGALDPSLRLGDWVIGERVTGDAESACDERWIAALSMRLPGASLGTIHAGTQLIASLAEKASLFRSGAIAADMESQLAAQAAAKAGIPLAILRCISDEADTALPPVVAVAMKPGGGLAIGAVMASILAHPDQISRLARNLAGFVRAYSSLKAGARAAGPRLAFGRR